MTRGWLSMARRRAQPPIASDRPPIHEKLCKNMISMMCSLSDGWWLEIARYYNILICVLLMLSTIDLCLIVCTMVDGHIMAPPDSETSSYVGEDCHIVQYHPKWVVSNSTVGSTEGRIISAKILPILLGALTKILPERISLGPLPTSITTHIAVEYHLRYTSRQHHHHECRRASTPVLCRHFE